MWESSSLPHFVLSYRILKSFAKLSKACLIRVMTMIRSLRKLIMTSDESKAVYCTFMECLLLHVYSDTHIYLDSFEFTDIASEVTDSQVYVDLFEVGEVAALNQSFGESHFQFDLDLTLLTRVYKNVRFFSIEDSAKILGDFVPTVTDLKEKASRIESRQLSSFQDSFRSQPNRSLDLSSKRSFLSLTLGGSTSSRSMKANSPNRAYTEADYVSLKLFKYFYFINIVTRHPETSPRGTLYRRLQCTEIHRLH